MKNTIIGLILGVIITMWALYLYFQKPESGQPNILPSEITPTVTLALTLSPAPTTLSDEVLIKKALAKKYKLSVDQISVIFKEIISNNAAGTVSFAGEGGWFLASKKGNNWEIVLDGNGTVSCESVAPYNFPVSMVPECIDINGQLIKL